MQRQIKDFKPWRFLSLHFPKRTIDLYFDSEDVNFKDVENRTVTLGGEQVYFDTKGFLVPTDPDFRYDIVEDEEEDDNNKNDKKGDESILHTADNLKDI